MRRTLDLPDAPGVWIWRYRNKKGPSATVYVWMEMKGSALVYNSEQSGCILPVAELLDEYGNGQWQGPINWEEENAQNA